jgi:hypothetical protein
VKLSLEKQPKIKQGATNKTLTSLEIIPAASHPLDNGKSLGNPMVEMATPNGTINLSEGTKKNELWV